MFNWLRDLFKQPEVPVQQGIYRSSRPKREPGQPRPVTETLFAKPVPLPEVAQVDVVAPTTEADRYQWIDYGQPGQPAVKVPEPVADTNPPVPDSGDWPGYCSTGNPVNLSGSMLCLTGLSYDYFLCTGYIVPPPPRHLSRRYGAISG